LVEIELLNKKSKEEEGTLANHRELTIELMLSAVTSAILAGMRQGFHWDLSLVWKSDKSTIEISLGLIVMDENDRQLLGCFIQEITA
jgi:hypothetical protein